MSLDMKQDRSKKYCSYQILKKLGGGAFGTVFLAKKQDKTVALKEITCQDFDETNRALGEIIIAKNLSHPNVIKYNDVFLDMYDGDLKVYIDLEYCEFGDFKKYAIKNTMSEGAILTFALQIASALEFMHQHNVIHRDLKPDNMLMTNDLQIQICDFGCSTLKESSSQNHTQVGTLYYAAPEVMKGLGGHSFPVDIFAFGAILVFLVTKSEKPPIYMELMEDSEGYFKNLQGQLESLNISGFYFNLVKSCLQKDPSKRPSAKQVNDMLKNHMNGSNHGINKVESSLDQGPNDVSLLHSENAASEDIPETPIAKIGVYMCCKWLYVLDPTKGTYECASKEGGWTAQVACWGPDNCFYTIYANGMIYKHNTETKDEVRISDLNWASPKGLFCINGLLYYIGADFWAFDPVSKAYYQLTHDGNWNQTTAACFHDGKFWVCKGRLYSIDLKGQCTLESKEDWSTASSIFAKDDDTLCIVCSWIWDYSISTSKYSKGSRENGWLFTGASAFIDGIFYFVQKNENPMSNFPLMSWNPKDKICRLVNKDDWKNCMAIL